MRIVRSDGKIIDTIVAKHNVNIGMISGRPTAEQYEEAAKQALDTARRIREQEVKK